ncbi:hypothetical protein J0J34_06915 [Lactococcus garvieae]|uniref:Uncharacterized protein n=2 Tax=Streptococcaceae TaxID=1300 RepID=F9VF16_LACGL|nr:hypothetical protein [Lactococcus garvieae]QSR11884.1 hypothetical protein J0J35_05540 [Lactococcus sp. LG606]BAK58949.1 hypothetical protein LCGT_1436 [Lactococcus garvieae ATCC 49156]BAK60917.1 hypothetical protein LCGL_1457 [Lactococcus garvieae Lg2]QQB43754.1 hypothetical protein I6H59_08910 [Lactococcus garvieae]
MGSWLAMKTNKYQIAMTTLAIIGLIITFFTGLESLGKLIIKILLVIILIVSVTGLIKDFSK